MTQDNDHALSENEMQELLDTHAARINSPEFIDKDPVQFPRMFDDQRDAEIASLLCATIAWGNRKMICSNCQKMLTLMDMQPYRYVMDEGYEDLPEGNIHRTFFNKNFQYYLRGLRSVLTKHATMADFAAHSGAPESEYPAWTFAHALNEALKTANGGACDSRCLPQNLDGTALKRLNMALRWLVRDDGIVDMGWWRGVLSPSQLFIPLDVHVSNVSHDLGLLTRRSNDRKAVLELTERLRQFRPEDPVYYDYALFGLGIEAKG